MPSMCFPSSAAKRAMKSADELGHVLEAFAQGGHPDGEHVEPVIEVLAEASLLHEADQILVGRRDQPEVDLDRVLGADGIDLALLQRTQQLHLRIERELADLVKEQRAVTGLLEFPGPLLGSAGKRALLVAEQDALHQILGNGAAIDRDKRPAGACAFALDGTRDQLLADAALTFDQHGYGRIGGALPELDDPGHRLAAGDEIGKTEFAPSGGLDPGQLVLQRPDLERVLDGNFEPLGAHRLDHEVDGARAHGGDGRVDAAIGRLHDGRRLPGQGPDGGKDRHPIGARHDEVEQDETELARGVGFERRKRLFPALGDRNGITEALDGLFENTTLSRVVADDQDTFRHDAILATVTLGHETGSRSEGPLHGPRGSAPVPKLCSGRVNIPFIPVRFW